LDAFIVEFDRIWVSHLLRGVDEDGKSCLDYLDNYSVRRLDHGFHSRDDYCFWITIRTIEDWIVFIKPGRCRPVR